MRVYFTDHAKKRCEEQGIPLGRIVREFKNAPKISGRWVTKYAFIKFEISGNDLLVVTVIAKKKYSNKNKKKYWQRPEHTKIQESNKTDGTLD